jgi:hypothetical protein
MSLSLTAWAQCLYYGSRWKIYTAFPLGLFILLCFGGIEAALILTVRPVYRQGKELPVVIIGIVAAVLIALGLLPPYVEIWKRRGRVIGIGTSPPQTTKKPHVNPAVSARSHRFHLPQHRLAWRLLLAHVAGGAAQL